MRHGAVEFVKTLMSQLPSVHDPVGVADEAHSAVPGEKRPKGCEKRVDLVRLAGHHEEGVSVEIDEFIVETFSVRPFSSGIPDHGVSRNPGSFDQFRDARENQGLDDDLDALDWFHLAHPIRKRIALQ